MDRIYRARQYLLSYRDIKKEIDRIERELNEIYADIDEKTRPQMLYLHCRLRALASKCMEIDRALQALPEEKRTVLRCRYVLGCGWEEICENIGCDFDRAVKIHSGALCEIAL